MNPGTDWLVQAQRLFDALRAPGGSMPTAATAATAAPAASAASGESGAHASDCSWCPVCQAAAVIRGERPEVTEALADILTTTAAALRTFAESAQTTAPQTTAPQTTAPQTTAAAPAAERDDAEAGAPPPVVQQIEIV